MNILFVCKNLDSANGICVQSVSNVLAKNHNVYVVCSSKTYNKKKDGIEYINVRNDALTLLSMSKHRFIKKIGRYLNKIWIVAFYFAWPFCKPFYYTRLKNRCLKTVDEKQIDILIPVYGPIETVYVAKYIKEKRKKIIMMPYFLDSLLGGPTPRFMKESTKIRKASVIEKKVAEVSDNIVMMASTKKCYINFEYKEKLNFLDLPLLNRRTFTGSKKKLLKTDTKSVVFVGNISKQIRNPETILEIVDSIKGKHIEFYFVGNFDCDDVFEKYTKQNKRIHRVSSVSYETAQLYMSEADYLLNIGNSLSFMIPSKLFEYMSFSKPIISTTKVDNDPALEYLKCYYNSLIVDERCDVKKNAYILDKYLLSADQYSCDIPNENIYNLLYLNTPEAFLDHIESVISENERELNEK